MPSFLGFLGPIGTQELVIIVLLVLLLFGAKKVPEFMKAMGEGVREFRKSSREIMREFEEEASRPEPVRPIPPPAKAPSAEATAPVGAAASSETDGRDTRVESSDNQD